MHADGPQRRYLRGPGGLEPTQRQGHVKVSKQTVLRQAENDDFPSDRQASTPLCGCFYLAFGFDFFVLCWLLVFGRLERRYVRVLCFVGFLLLEAFGLFGFKVVGLRIRQC